MAYTVELWRDGETGIEETILSTDDLAAARRVFEEATAHYAGRPVLLRNKAMVLRRSQPEPVDRAP